MNNYITERCLKFKVYGDITTSIVCKIANLFIDNDIDNDIDFVAYFGDGYHPAEFTVRRSGKKWDDIITLINSVKPCKYKYNKEIFYITNKKRKGVLGNMQLVCIC